MWCIPACRGLCGRSSRIIFEAPTLIPLPARGRDSCKPRAEVVTLSSSDQARRFGVRRSYKPAIGSGERGFVESIIGEAGATARDRCLCANRRRGAGAGESDCAGGADTAECTARFAPEGAARGGRLCQPAGEPVLMGLRHRVGGEDRYLRGRQVRAGGFQEQARHSGKAVRSTGRGLLGIPIQLGRARFERRERRLGMLKRP